MGKRTELPNINAIGTADNPVTTIHVKNIAGVEKIYYTAPVYTTSPDAETIAGVKFNTGTGNLEFSAPIVSDIDVTGDLDVTGDVTIIGATDITGDTDVTGDLVVTGDIGCTGDYNLTGVANKGFKPNSAGDITFYQKGIFTGNIEANGNIKLPVGKYINDTGGSTRGINFDASGNTVIQQNLNATGYINSTGASNGLSFTGENASFTKNVIINGDCSVPSATGDYYHGSNKGKTGTITLASTTQIQVSGGVIYGWS